MKKKLTIALLLFIGTTSAFAQDQKFRFGVNGNVGSSWLKPTKKGLTSGVPEASFGYGIMLDWRLGENYSFTTGIDVLYKGGSFAYAQDSISGSSKILLQNLEIPLLLKMKTKPIGYITYFIQFGGSLGYALSRTGNYSLIDGHKMNRFPTIGINDDNLKKYVNPFSASLIVAAGLEYNISGKTSLIGSIFFNNAFMDLLTDPKPTATKPAIDLSSRVNVLGIKVGVFF